MFGMVMDSAKLFLAGKLFQEPGKAMQQLAIGVGAGLIAVWAVGQFAPLWAATAAGGAVSGLLQPYLFKDLKYA
ncbi:MAG: hypothetical protein K0U74_02920 [Alphaproteobacteria bacterium]|nr:hypothetical protein [Alphaproteobacteria bacterium]